MRSVWQKFISATPTVSTTPAYTAGDVVGTKMTFSEAGSGGSKTGEVRGVTVYDLDKQGQDLDLVLFSQDPAATTFTDNAAFDPADADLSKIIAVIPLTTHKGFSDNGLTAAKNISYPYIADSKNQLYGVLVARNAGSLQYTTTTAITVQIELIAD